MKFIRNHKIFTFYVSTFCLTGILFFLQMLLFPTFPIALYLFSPAIVALSLILIIDKKNGIAHFFKCLSPSKANYSWVVLAIVLPIMIVLIAVLLYSFMNELHGVTNTITFDVFIIILLGCIGEELGWRAYLLPLLLKKHSTIKASIILGILWGIWHVGDYGEGIGFLLFVLSTIGISIIMTWPLLKSHNNFLTALFFHTFYNLSSIYFAIIPETGVINIQYHLLFAIITCSIGFILILVSPMFKHKESVLPAV